MTDHKGSRVVVSMSQSCVLEILRRRGVYEEPCMVLWLAGPR